MVILTGEVSFFPNSKPLPDDGNVSLVSEEDGRSINFDHSLLMALSGFLRVLLQGKSMEMEVKIILPVPYECLNLLKELLHSGKIKSLSSGSLASVGSIADILRLPTSSWVISKCKTLLQSIPNSPNIIYKAHNKNMSPLKAADVKRTEGSVFGDFANNAQLSKYPVTTMSSSNFSVMIERNQNNLFECSFCGYSSKQKGRVKKHISSKHLQNQISFKPKVMRYDCEKCDFSCSTEKILKIHIRKDHLGFALECSKCNYKTSDASSMLHHTRVKHEGFSVSCKFCPKSFTKQSTLNKHMGLKHRDHSSLALECSKCDYKTSDASSMWYHRRVKHEGFTVSCKFCSKSFTKQSTLNKHVMQKHK